MSGTPGGRGGGGGGGGIAGPGPTFSYIPEQYELPLQKCCNEQSYGMNLPQTIQYKSETLR